MILGLNVVGKMQQENKKNGYEDIFRWYFPLVLDK